VPYIPHTALDIDHILKAIGVGSVEELVKGLPEGSRVRGGLDLPKGISEQELKGLLAGLAGKNNVALSSFLGGGAYNHFTPSIVDHLISRSEFFTAYTPYQPEVSQGTLQAVFEYQTLVCQLTSMDVSNASLYDGATAAAEAALMARRITKRPGVLLSGALHPEYASVVRTYLKGAGEDVSEVPFCTEGGITLAQAAEKYCTPETACLIVQHPNFFGSLEEVADLAAVVHGAGGLLIVVVTEPVSLGLLKPPGALGADIVVGENQSFGSGLNYGGPYLGFIATKDKFVRQMPGRLVGQTVDDKGQSAYCLTFATREQHIRRERATSNICTNHALNALAAAVFLLALGRGGLKSLARVNLEKASYLKERLAAIDGVSVGFTAPTFNEFTITLKTEPAPVLKRLLKKGIIGGLGLARFHPSLSDHLLVTATEMNTKEDMDAFVEALSGILAEEKGKKRQEEALGV
jgi:glycine dehydrogenase subunit 1